MHELPAVTGHLSSEIRGVWWLLSREDWTDEGQQRIDPIMGPDPIGILTYASTHFAAQFMKRTRNLETVNEVFAAGQNNTAAVGGYDAYFGSYEVNEETGRVAHTLIGSINPNNVGITVSRDLRVQEDQLMIQLKTTTQAGEAVTRTLKWKRLS